MSALPPPRFTSSSNYQPGGRGPFDFSSNQQQQNTNMNNSNIEGLTRTPPPSNVRIPIPTYDNVNANNKSSNQQNSSNNNGNNNSNLSEQEIQQLRVYQQQHDMSIKETAQRDKKILMNRIEELSRTIHELQRRGATQSEELESYHRAFGTLDDFTSRQVRVREEMVVLRDAVRMWQDREADARREVSRLEKVLESIKRGQQHTSGESRLKDIEERLSLAHLQRHELSQEIDDIVEMERTKRERHSVLLQRTAAMAANFGRSGGKNDSSAQLLAAELATIAPGVDGSYLNWQMRGKLADLKRLLKQKDESIESLQKTADSLQSVSQSERFPAIGATNRPCPGCSDFAWKSPFCPTTGQKHLAFDETLTLEKQRIKEAALRAPVFVPLSEEEVTEIVTKWLDEGLWSMLKEYAANGQEKGNVLYREKASGRIVEDLRAVVEHHHLIEHEQHAKDYEKMLKAEQLRREALALEAAKDPIPALAVQPSMKTEVLNLIAALEAKKDENLRLRALLDNICASGSVGVKSDSAILAATAAAMKNNNNDDLMNVPSSSNIDASSSPLGGRSSPAPTLRDGDEDDQSPSNQQNINNNNSFPGKPTASRTFAPYGSSKRVFPSTKEKEFSNSSPSQQRRILGDGSIGGELQVSTNPNDLTIALHDEDDVQTYTKMMRLQGENAALARRASELVLALVDRDDQINQLRESLDRVSAVDSDRYVAQLRRENAQLRDRLLQEERRTSNMEGEVKRLKRFEPSSFH